MSKSLGNFTTAQDLLNKGVAGETIRFALLAAHYRQPLNWSTKGLEQAQKSLDKFYRILDDLTSVPDIKADVPAAFFDALLDDLNSPKAYAELNALAKMAQEQKTAESKAVFKTAANLMGFLMTDPQVWLSAANSPANDIDATWVEGLLAERTDAKKAKNFARADAIRDELAAKGIVIEDTPQGPKWHKG